MSHEVNSIFQSLLDNIKNEALRLATLPREGMKTHEMMSRAGEMGALATVARQIEKTLKELQNVKGVEPPKP